MISAIPERLLNQAITIGLDSIRRNPKLLATLFQNLTDPEFRRLLKFLTESNINIATNYPRQQIKVPAITIIMKSEKEAHPFMGDNMGFLDETSAELSAHFIDNTAPVSPLQGTTTKVAGPFQVEVVDGNKIAIDTADYLDLKVNVGFRDNYKIYVTSGPGKGKVYPVKGFELDYIQLETNTNAMQVGSVFDIRSSAGGVAVGEPQRVFESGATVSRFGAIYESTYLIDIMASTTEEVSYLYYIVKAIIYLTRQSLEAQGLMNMSLYGEDMLYRAEFESDEIFRRVLRVTFKNIFSILIEDDIVNEFKVDLC